MLEGQLEEIHFANRNAARSHNRIALIESVCQRLAGSGEHICDQGQGFWDRADTFHQCRQGGAIAFVDLAGHQRLAGLREFRTGGQQAHHWPSSHAQSPETGCRQQSDPTRGYGCARLGEYRALLHVLPAGPDIFPGTSRGQDYYLARRGRVNVRVFLHHDGVGTSREGRTSEQTHAGAGSNLTQEYLPGGNLSRQTQTCR